jgi:predicted PurR-regulated permease PerM
MDPQIVEFFARLDIWSYINTALDSFGQNIMVGISGVSAVVVDVVIAIAISLLILLEWDKLRQFGRVTRKSRLSFVYIYFLNFGKNFVKTFGKVMRVQVTIALVNMVLSMIVLGILGFPSVLALGMMIFILGLIPVAGVIISLIPLCIIAFNVGGPIKILEVLIMVIVLHFVEAYILNPRLMSQRTSLPVCLVFIILIVAQKYLHVWGLLIGVPLFIFLMSVFEVDYEDAFKPKKYFTKERKAAIKEWLLANPLLHQRYHK